MTIFDKRLFINLLAEIPEQSVVFKTTGETYTAKDMMLEIQNDTELGNQYSADLLRIARDFLQRQSKHHERKKGR